LVCGIALTSQDKIDLPLFFKQESIAANSSPTPTLYPHPPLSLGAPAFVAWTFGVTVPPLFFGRWFEFLASLILLLSRGPLNDIMFPVSFRFAAARTYAFSINHCQSHERVLLFQVSPSDFVTRFLSYSFTVTMDSQEGASFFAPVRRQNGFFLLEAWPPDQPKTLFSRPHPVGGLGSPVLFLLPLKRSQTQVSALGSCGSKGDAFFSVAAVSSLQVVEVFFPREIYDRVLARCYFH